MTTGEEIRWQRIFWGFMVILLPLLIIRSLNFPINVDEPLHYNHAKKVIEWYQTQGENEDCLNTPWSNLKYYGQSVDNLTALINSTQEGIEEYKVRHITGAVFAWLFILFTALMAFEVTGRYRTAILAGMALLLIPPVMGQFSNNLKDIPFGAGYAFSIWSLIRVVKRLPFVPWTHIIYLSLSIAFLISVRIGGLIVYPYLFLFVGIWFFINHQFNPFSGKNRADLLRLFSQGIVVLVAGYFLGLVFWPYGLINPLTHPLESLSVMEDYIIVIRQIFEGDWYWSNSLPAHYLVKWLLISLPGVILFGIVLYIIHLFVHIRKISIAEFIVLFTLIFPLAYVIIIKSNLYSGWRQMFFVAGHFAVISAIGAESVISYFSRKRSVAWLIVFILAAGSVSPVIHYIRNPDTAYIYFNIFAGGNSKAWSNYEYDYYWHGMKRAASWFDDHILSRDDTVVMASNFNLSLYFSHREDIKKVKYVHFDNRSEADWDYGIFGVNYIHPEQLKKERWKPAGIVKMFKDGYNNPLAVIIKRGEKNDLKGIQYAREGNCSKAIGLLKKAINNDPNNFVLYEYLAECYYTSGDTLACQRFVNKAQDLHPWSDKINMIDAQLEYDKGNYDLALKKCLKIVENNNKYYNIVPLLRSCYEKTGDLEMAEYYRDKLKKWEGRYQ